MSTEGQQSKDPTQDEERFWNDFDRQYFSPPHPSLVLLLKSHIWHLRHISSKVGSYLESKKTVKKKNKKNNSLYLRSVKFPIRLLTLDRGNSSLCSAAPGVFKYFSTSGTLSNEQIQGLLENDNVYKPLVSAKHDTNQRLPTFYSSSLPDAIHLSLYVPPSITKSDKECNGKESSRSDKNNKNNNKQDKDKPNDKFKDVDESLANFVDSFRSVQLLDSDNVPQIICGPCPSWFSKGKGRFKKGIDLGPKYKRCDKVVKNPQGLLSDPVWQHFNTNYITDTSFEQLTFPPGAKLVRSDSKLDDDGDVPEGTDLLNYHNMCDSGSCRVDYSPHLFTFVSSRKNPLCKRCLGFPGLCCNLCKNSQGSSSAIFSSQFLSDEKYHMTYNSVDMFRLRSSTNESIQNYYVNPYQRPNYGKDLGTFSLVSKEELEKEKEKNKDNDKEDSSKNDDEQLIYNYIQTLESLNVLFSSLLNRVLKEYKPDSSRWQEIETKMLDAYIEQYNNNTFDNRYTYSVQRQSVDVLQIRLKVKRSSELPPSWTDRALCSICGSDDDWDDDPILFCDCCFIPMHFCCLGYKPGTLSDIKQKLNMNKIQRLNFFTYLLNNPDKPSKKVKIENMDDLVDLDEDEWYCPVCSYLMDQLSFMDENLVMAIIRTVGGPKNVEQLKLIHQTNSNSNKNNEDEEGSGNKVSGKNNNMNRDRDTRDRTNGLNNKDKDKEQEKSNKKDKQDQVMKYNLPYILGFDYDNPLERVYLSVHCNKPAGNYFNHKPNTKEIKLNEKVKTNVVDNTTTLNKDNTNNNNNKDSEFKDFYLNNNKDSSTSNKNKQDNTKYDELEEPKLEQTSVLNLYGSRKESISYNSNNVLDPKVFCKLVLSKKGLYFEHTFWKLLSRSNINAIQEYLNHFTIEDLSMSRLVQQDKIIQNAKLMTKKRSGSIESKLSTSRSISLGSNKDFVSVKKEHENGNKRDTPNKKDDLRYSSNSALNCKNPLKRLYVSINLRNLSKICSTTPSSHKDKSHGSYSSVPIIPSSSGTGTTIHIQKEPIRKEKNIIEFDDVDIVVKIPVCIFCGFDAFIPGGGPMKKTSSGGTWGHIKCALANDCTIEPEEINYGTFVPKIKALKCIFCSNWSTSVVQCSYGNCCKAFHVPCSSASPNCLFTWDTNGKPDVLCPVHSKGLAPTTLLRKLQMRLLSEKKDKEREKGGFGLNKDGSNKDKLDSSDKGNLLKKLKIHKTPGRHKLKYKLKDKRLLMNKIRNRGKDDFTLNKDGSSSKEKDLNRKESKESYNRNKQDKEKRGTSKYDELDLDDDNDRYDDGYLDSDKEKEQEKSNKDSVIRSVIKGSRDMVDNLSISENLHLTHFLRPNYNNLTKLLEVLLNEKVGTIFQSNLSSNCYYKENINRTNSNTSISNISTTNIITCYSNISSSRSKYTTNQETQTNDSSSYNESEKDEDYIPTILNPRSTSLTRFSSTTSRQSSSYNDLLDKEVDVFIELDPDPDPEIEMLLNKNDSIEHDPKKLLLGKEQLLSKHKLTGQGRCPLNNINANNCFWCCLGFDLEGHNRHVFDDKTPTSKQVLTILYNNNMSNIPLIKSMIDCKKYDKFLQKDNTDNNIKEEEYNKNKQNNTNKYNNSNNRNKELDNNTTTVNKDNKNTTPTKTKEEHDTAKYDELDLDDSCNEYGSGSPEDVCMDIEENNYLEKETSMKIPWSILSNLIMNDAIDDKISSFICNDLVNNNKLVKKNEFVINKLASEALVRLFNTFEPESTKTVVKTLFSLMKHIEFINKIDELYGYNTFYFSTGSAIDTQHLLEKKTELNLSSLNFNEDLTARSDSKTVSLVSNSTNDATFANLAESVNIPPLNLDALYGRDDKVKLLDSGKSDKINNLNFNSATSSNRDNTNNNNNKDKELEKNKDNKDLNSNLINISKNLVLPDGVFKQSVDSLSTPRTETKVDDKNKTNEKNGKTNGLNNNKDSPTSNNKDTNDKELSTPKTDKEKNNAASKSPRNKNKDNKKEKESPKSDKDSDKSTPKSAKTKESPKSSKENKKEKDKTSPKSSRDKDSPRTPKEKQKENEQKNNIKQEETTNRNGKNKQDGTTSNKDKDFDKSDKNDKNNKSNLLDLTNLKIEEDFSPVRDKNSKESPRDNKNKQDSISRSNKGKGSKKDKENTNNDNKDFKNTDKLNDDKQKDKELSTPKAIKEKSSNFLKEFASVLSNNLDIRDMFKAVKDRGEKGDEKTSNNKNNNKQLDKEKIDDRSSKEADEDFKDTDKLNVVDNTTTLNKDNTNNNNNKDSAEEKNMDKMDVDKVTKSENVNKDKDKLDKEKEMERQKYNEEKEKRDKEKAAVKEEVYKLLKEVNEVEIIKIEKTLFPTSIIRKYVDNKKITICKVCLEFKYIENEMDSNKRKRNIYNESYRKCNCCNVEVCNSCLSTTRQDFENMTNNSTLIASDYVGEEVDDYRFVCVRCKDISSEVSFPLLCCVLCSRYDGLMVKLNPKQLSFIPSKTSVWNSYCYAHLICLEWLYWSKNVNNTNKKQNKSLFDQNCNYCGMLTGATITCSNGSCLSKFHPSCAAFLGCKIDVSKKNESVVGVKRALCMRHTLISIARSSAAERKFMVAPCYLYEVLLNCNYFATFFKGVYLSPNCINTKAKLSSRFRLKKKKSLDYKSNFSVMKMASYINYGLVVNKSPQIHDLNLTEALARERLIQGMNYVFYQKSTHGPHNFFNLFDTKDPSGGVKEGGHSDFKNIINLVRNGLLKPAQGSKRGRKPKSLDGSECDKRQKMPMEDILKYGHCGVLDNGEYYCPLCFSIYFENSPGLPGDDLHWIGCDKCERWFHFVCAGVWVDYRDKDSWFCFHCSGSKN